MQLLKIAIVFLILILAGCESNVKYPSRSAIFYSSPLKSKNRVISSGRAINLKAQKGSNFTGSVSNSHYSFPVEEAKNELCLSYRYIRLKKLHKARRILLKLEKERLSNVYYARVYALLGIIDKLRGRSGRNYFEIAYAYDPNNKVSEYMLSAKKPSLNFALQFPERWCSYAYKR